MLDRQNCLNTEAAPLDAPNSAVDAPAQTVLCLCFASYSKGADFLAECKHLGSRVLLMLPERLAGAEWPSTAIDDRVFVPEGIGRDDIVAVAGDVARSYGVDRVVGLDDSSVDTAAKVRERLGLAGMGVRVAQRFRDKLAMRQRARTRGIPIPEFVAAAHHGDVARFVGRVDAPWVLKPRSEASARGVEIIERADDLERRLAALGGARDAFLVESYVPGDVFHVDALVSDGRVVFDVASRYGRPPLDVVRDGGVFTSRTLAAETSDAEGLRALNREVLSALGLERGAAHTEFIKGPDGTFAFLEAGARVGDAKISQLVGAATGVNLWREWARLEAGIDVTALAASARCDRHAGIVLSLARQEWPDLSRYDDPEVVWRLERECHAGLVVASADPSRVEHLLADYTARFARDFL